MRYFEDLGVGIARRWQRARFHRDDFPLVAYEELARTPPADAMSCMEIVEWLATADVCPYQQHFDSSFGQPPVTVFWHPRFYIEVLFWATSTTAIHEHGFGGAFSVLEGTSLETTYVFDAHERFGDRILLGDIKLLGSALLPKGTWSGSTTASGSFTLRSIWRSQRDGAGPHPFGSQHPPAISVSAAARRHRPAS